MPVVSVGQKLPSIYLDRFQPVEGLTYRISVLDTRAIATEFHFIDIPSRGVKGSFQCIQGACCAAFGRRSQTYNVPIFVYQNPGQSTDGEVQVWRMTAPQWKKFSDMAQVVDFGAYDILLVAQKRGYGLDLSYSAVPDVKMRDYWSQEQRDQIPLSVASFFQLGEASLVDPMNYNEWNQLLYDCGFDLQNMTWPGGVSPMSPGNARRSIGGAVAAPALPMAPSSGVLPSVPGMPPVPAIPSFPAALPLQGSVGPGAAPIMQPPSPAAGPVPGAVPAQVPAPAPALPAFVPASAPAPAPAFAPVPVEVVAPATIPAGVTGGPSAGPVQQSVVSVFGPIPAAEGAVVQQPNGDEAVVVQGPVVGVPLGTAPVIPQTAMAPPSIAPVPQAQDANTIPGATEISMEEMNELLS
jgi:hypothetical protein